MTTYANISYAAPRDGYLGRMCIVDVQNGWGLLTWPEGPAAQWKYKDGALSTHITRTESLAHR